MRLLLVSEVAEMLRCAESTVYALIDQGKLAGFRIGPHRGGIRISEDDVQAYLDGARVNQHLRPRPAFRSKHFS